MCTISVNSGTLPRPSLVSHQIQISDAKFLNHFTTPHCIHIQSLCSTSALAACIGARWAHQRQHGVSAQRYLSAQRQRGRTFDTYRRLRHSCRPRAGLVAPILNMQSTQRMRATPDSICTGLKREYQSLTHLQTRKEMKSHHLPAMTAFGAIAVCQFQAQTCHLVSYWGSHQLELWRQHTSQW